MVDSKRIGKSGAWPKIFGWELEKVWKIIETERVTGFEHRAPTKKLKKEPLKPFVEKESQGCLLKFNKIIKID